MLAHRLRRWPNIETALGECPVFAEHSVYMYLRLTSDIPETETIVIIQLVWNVILLNIYW